MSAEMRKQLRQAVREVWNTDAAESLRNTLGAQAVSSGFAKCLEDLMARGAGGKASFEACAKRHNLKTAYKGAWGKPT
ncbi:MAG: hypothetical protein QXQ20_08720 [Candidatus Nezhaarchaeales archaeon]